MTLIRDGRRVLWTYFLLSASAAVLGLAATSQMPKKAKEKTPPPASDRANYQWQGYYRVAAG